MARGISRLPATFKSLAPGMHCDGGNLYLQISEGAERNRRQSWIFRYVLKGHKARDMGLGSVNDVTLKEAREKAREYRNLVKEGIDPIDRRNATVAKNIAARVGVMTFDQAAESYIKQHRAGWRSPIHAAQWNSTLRTYASPTIGKMSVADVTTAHIMKILEPIWQEKSETASRVRGRIEKILSWATTSKFRSGDNPARWRDHLDNLLAAPSKVRKVKHQTALPYADMPAFMVELRQRNGMAALALEFTILTCVRTVDIRNARRQDIDPAKGMWTIPALSKTAREHRVPLSTAAIAAFGKARKIARDIGPCQTVLPRLAADKIWEGAVNVKTALSA
jgi:integrase